MNELLGGKFAPVTNNIGFLQYDCSSAACAFVAWQEGINKRRGVSFTKKGISGNLESVIQNLLPLTSVERGRYLFIPTRSNWIAFLDNGHQGTDVFSHLSYMARKLSCDAVRSTYVPEGRSSQYPAVIFELYGPKLREFMNYIRSVAVAYDGRKWTFSTGGEPQAFEEPQRYVTRSVRDRFTPEMLEDYLEALGIRAFEEGFYCPEGREAILIEKVGPIAPDLREFKLVDVQQA